MALYKKKVPGNSLIITVFIALVLSILCSSVLLLLYFNRNWQSQVMIDETLSRNIQSGINLILSDTSQNAGIGPDSLDLFNTGSDTVKIQKKPWGLFAIGDVRSVWGNRNKEKLFMYGPRPGKIYSSAIYLADHQTPLSLIGDVKLTGDVFLSKAGLRSGFINQRGYSYPVLLTGNVNRSDSLLPALNLNRKKYLAELMDLASDTGRIKSFQSVIPDTLNISFADTPRIIYQHGRTFISSKYLSGQIVIVGDSVIEVDQSAHLDNIILIAPRVIFKEYFSGSVQAIASDSLSAEMNTKFYYPSTLVLMKKTDHQGFATINIEKNCAFEGVILSLADSSDNEKTYLKIGQNSIVSGIIYIEGYVENMASINGTILTDYFIYRKGPSFYLNNLVDVEINRQHLSPYFLSSQIFENSLNHVITWVQ